MKVFLDTNVWLSATIFSGLCEELVLMCAERGGLYSSLLIQVEAHDVLKRKFPKTLNACDLFDASFQAAQLIADYDEPRDDNDRRLVAAAKAANMEMFVTGDKRVLGWAADKTIAGNLTIVSSREAWTALS
ncbi:MAG: putative toxin-antitoxin system toxin component, PIN family [Polaromonas sp.]